MNEPSQPSQNQVNRRESEKRPWQFSLRALFVLTAACAVLLSIATTFPVFASLVAAFVILPVAWVLLTGGLALLLERIFGRIDRMCGKASPQLDEDLRADARQIPESEACDDEK